MAGKRTGAGKPAGDRVIIERGGQLDDDEAQLDQGALGEESADDHDFDTFVAELASEVGSTYESKVYKTPSGYQKENDFLFAFRPGELTFTGLQLKVQREYGPGRYYCRTYVSGIGADNRPYNQLVKGGTFKFSIGATLGGGLTPGQGNMINPFAIAGGDANSMKLLEKLLAGGGAKPINGLDPMLAMMMENNRENSKLMLTLLMGMMGLMQNRSASDNGGRDSIDQAMRLLRLSREINGDAAEPEDTLGRVLGTAERVLPSLFNAIGSTYGAKPRPKAIPLGRTDAQGAPIEPANVPLDPRLLALLQAQADSISKLPQAFAFGIPDDTLIDAMIEPIETDDQLDALKAIAAHPQLIEALISVVPALEAHAARLITFVAALQAELPEVEIEDDPDAASNGNANVGAGDSSTVLDAKLDG